MAAGVDQLGELRFADREAGGDRADAAGFLLEVPDELAAGTFSGEASAVFGEDRDPRAEEGASHGWNQRDPTHQVEYRRRIGLAGGGPVAAQQRIAPLGRTP